MTILTRAQLYCDVGLRCNKQIVKTIEGPGAAQQIRTWAKARGWGSWGQRDACPECWKEMHRSGNVEPRDLDEEVQAGIDGERGG